MKSNKLIITDKTLLKGRVAVLTAVALALALVTLAYELGLSRAGFNRMDSIDERAYLEKQNRELQVEVKTLRERVAVLETAAKIDQAGYSQVEAELVELQNRILDQQEDIEFYKGIVKDNDGTGLRIQDFQVVKGLGAQEFDLRLVLAQAFRKDKLVSGSVEIVVEGLQRGEAARLALGDIGPSDGSGSKQLKYSFRYFQDIKAGLILPEDFVPERVHVIVRPTGKKSKTVEDFFVWKVKPG